MTTTTTTRAPAALVLLAVALAGVASAPAAPAAASQAAGASRARRAKSPKVQVVAEGLDSPRQMAVGPDGKVYVALAGRGGDTCVTIPASPESGQEGCVGLTGAIGRVDTKHREVDLVLEDLLSLGGPDGTGETVGADAVAFDSKGNLYTGVTASASLIPPGVPPDVQAAVDEQAGKLLRAKKGSSELSEVADVAAFELANNPVPEVFGENFPNTNLYGVAAKSAALQYAVDAGGDIVLKIDDGQVSLFATIEPHEADGNTFDSVPTSIALDKKGNAYVGELAGFTPGGASVYKISPSGKLTVLADGLNPITAVTVDSTGNVWATELLSDPAALDPNGGADPGSAVVKIDKKGKVTRYLEGKVQFPGGIAVGKDGYVYVANRTTSTSTSDNGGGQILRFKP